MIYVPVWTFKQVLVGIPQNIDQITFNVREQRYYFNGVSPFTYFDKVRNGNQNEIEEPKQINATLEEAFDMYECYDNENEIPF